MAHPFLDRFATLVIARAAIWIAAALALLIVIVLAAGYWLLNTASGTGWIWARIASAVPGELTAASLDGSLADGLRLQDIVYANPSLTVTISRAELALDPDLFPPALKVVRLDARDVEVRQLEQAVAEEPGGRFSPESLVLPLELDVRALDVSNLRVVNSSGEQTLALDRAELAGKWYETIVVSKVEIDSSAVGLGGSAALDLHEPFDASASFKVRYPLTLGGETVPLAILANAAGNLEHLRISLASDDPGAAVEGSLLRLLEEPAWDLRMRSPYLQWPLTGPSPNLRLRNVDLDSRGRLSDFTLAGDGLITAVAGEELQFSLDGHGDRDGFDVSSLVLQGAMLQAQSEGELRWAGGFSVAASAGIERFDPAVVTARWPASTPVAGAAEVAWSAGRLELHEVRLRVEETEQRVDVAGVIDLERGVVDVNLDWSELQWPIAGEPQRLGSDFGQVTVTGRPEAWTLEGRIAFGTPDLPQGTFQLAGTGNREEAALTLGDSQVLGGHMAGRVHYNWQEGGRWSASLSAEAIDTGSLALQWPGRISADFATTGQVEPLQVGVDIDRLSGVLRGRPIEATGGFRYANGNLAVQQLQLSSGESRLEADGSLRGEEGLDFAVDVASLAAFLREGAGALQAQGNVALKDGFPELQMKLEGRELAWRDYRLQSLSITTDDAAPLALRIDGQGLEAGGLGPAQVTVDFDGSRDRQQLALALTVDDRQVEVALDGQLDDWQRPLESAWAGQLQALRVEVSEDESYVLEEPAALRLATGLVALERACLRGRAASRICLRASGAGAAAFDLSAELDAVPVGLVKLLIETELEFTQTLDGTLAVRNAAGGELSADARVGISPGQIRSPDDARIAMRTGAGVFDLDLDQGRVLLARLNLPFSEAAAINAEFAVADVSMGQDSRVDGSLTVDLNDIGIAAALVAEIEEARGRVDVDLALSGTVADPVIFGEASLRNGALNYAPLGLRLSDIEITSRIQEGNRVDVQSTFRAGDGVGKLSSSTDALRPVGDTVRLRLSGKNLTVVDLPQVNVIADMDVDLGVTPEKVSINGEALIPHARLSPREITSTQVGESDDVVIVANRAGVEEAQADKPPPFAIEGQVELTLGDDVVVDFDAAQTRLNGSARFVWNGPPMPLATGEYKVAGRFEAYGQLLEITEGSVRFPGAPADNPQLRIRAEREIFGNPRIRSAGVLVSGTAQDPELEVYTVPDTNDERALTMLITGSDFNYEQGVGAVDVGTYIAPDLYLSYGIGLFDRENVISVRYDLAKGFGIKATSGKRAEGVDLSYTFER